LEEILCSEFGDSTSNNSEQGVWRIRSNLEIQNMCKPPDIVTDISQKTGMVGACRQNGRYRPIKNGT